MKSLIPKGAKSTLGLFEIFNVFCRTTFASLTSHELLTYESTIIIPNVNDNKKNPAILFIFLIQLQFFVSTDLAPFGIK